MDALELGKKIRALRKAKRMTINQLEFLTGVSNGNISRIECGKQWPGALKLQKIASALGTTVDQLFVGVFEPVQPEADSVVTEIRNLNNTLAELIPVLRENTIAQQSLEVSVTQLINRLADEDGVDLRD